MLDFGEELGLKFPIKWQKDAPVGEALSLNFHINGKKMLQCPVTDK